MKKYSFLPVLASVSLLTLPLHATLLVEETFDYTVGSNIGTVEATGTGLTGDWQRGFTNTDSAILRVNAKTDWEVPSGFGFTPSPRSVGTPVDQVNSAAVDLAGAAQINFDANGVFYYSYLLSYGTDNRSRVSFGSFDTPDLMRVQGLASGTLRVFAGGDFSAGVALEEENYLVIGRITTAAAGNDEHRIWVYDSSETIALSDPGTVGSYAAQAGEITGTASMLQFSNVIDAEYGDFRMGTSWEAVAVPEPGTYSLLAAMLAGTFVLLRRRRAC